MRLHRDRAFNLILVLCLLLRNAFVGQSSMVIPLIRRGRGMCAALDNGILLHSSFL
jgi:hypothetical protein